MWVIALVAALVLLKVGLSPVGSAPRTIGVQIGQIAPDFTLQTLSGARVRLWSLRGHPVMLNFFASWCVPCNEEAPELAKVGRTARGLHLIGVDMTGSEASLKAVQNFVTKYHLPYPVLLDLNNVVSNKYEITYAPTTYFINRQGVIMNVQSVRLTAGDIRQQLGRMGVVLP